MSRGETRVALRSLGSALRGLLALRWARWTLALVLVALVARAGLGRLLAFVVQREAERRGLACAWGDLDLELLAGGGTLRDLVLRPAAPSPRVEPGARSDGAPRTGTEVWEADGEPLLEVQYATFDLDVLALLRGRLSIARAEVDGLDAWCVRDAAGAWNLARHVRADELRELLGGAPPAAGAEAGAPAAEPPPEERAIDLAPPLAIDALRLQHARLHVADRAQDPPLALAFELHAGLSRLDDPARPLRFSAAVLGGELLEAARVEGSAVWRADAIALELTASLAGLRPGVLARQLEALDVRPVARTLEMHLAAEARVAVGGAAREALEASLELSRVRLVADGEEELALDRLRLERSELSSASAALPGLVLEGVRGRAGLEPDGALRLAGLDLAGSRWADAISAALAAGEREAPAAPGGPPRWLALLVAPDAELYEWSLGALEVRDVALELTDRTLDPPAAFPFLVDALKVGAVTHARGAEARTIPVEVACRAPGMAETIALSGSIGPFAPRRSVDLELRVEGLGLHALEARMRAAGIERTLERGAFQARLVGAAETGADGCTRGELALDGLTLEDGGSLLGVQSIHAKDILLDPAQERLRFGDVEIQGAQLTVGRDPSQRFFALGLRTLGFSAPAASASSGAAPSSAAGVAAARAAEAPSASVAGGASGAIAGGPSGPASAAAPPAALPRIELGRLAWARSDVELVDQLADPPRRFRLDELGFELTDLVLGGDPAQAPAEPARFHGRVRAPGLVDELTLEGLVRSRPGPIDLSLELALRAQGVTGELARPYLRALGVEPVLASGALAAAVEGSLRQAQDGWRAGLALRDASLADGESVLLGCDELRVEDARLGDTLAIGTLALVAPRARLGRDAEGHPLLAGVRWLGSPPAQDAVPAGAAEAPAAPLALPALPPVAIERVAIEDARVAWTDAARTPTLATELALSASASGLATDGREGSFEARLSIPETLERLDARGTLAVGPQALSLSLALDAAGVRAGPLARLLPDGVALEAQDGALRLALDARVETAAEGGLAARLEARELAWGEPGREPWLALERAELAARADPLAGALAIGPLLVEGARLEARRDAQGTLHALGFALAAPAEAQAQAAASESVPATSDRAATSDAPVAGAEATAADPLAGAPRAAAALPFARVDLVGDVSLALERLRLRDASLGEDALPLELAATLRVPAPRALLAIDPPASDPIAWELEGSLAGVVERWRVHGELAPFAVEPRATAALAALGVRPAGLLERAPAAASGLAGELEHATLEGRLEATLFVRRARAAELGLGRPFGAEIALAGLALRDAPGGTVLAGVDAVRASVERVDLARGLVHVKELVVERPRGLVRRDAAGVHALGLLLPLAAGDEPEPAGARDADAGAPDARAVEAVARAGEAGAPDASSAPRASGGEAASASPRGAASTGAPSAAAPTASSAPVPPADDAGDVRIDEILVQGIDFELRDESVAPAVRVPLDTLDLEVARFSTRGLAQGRAVRFSGALGCAGAPPVFDELALAGRVGLADGPSGWAQVSLGGLELPALAPLAAASGLTMEDGALDASVRLRLKGARGVGVDTSLVFSDLDLREPEGGLLERALSLPMALDTALFLLRNAAGEHRFSTGFTLDEGGISGAAVAGAATRAFAEVLARALAAVPLRILGALLPGGGEAEPAPEERWSLAFAPGASEPAAALGRALAEATERLVARRSTTLVLRHELGAQDLARAEERANPSPEACLELVRGLRQRKAELLRARDAQAREAHALLAIGEAHAAEAGVRLRALDRELADAEGALDRVLEILRSDSPRNREKRTRASARALAALRLAAIEAELRRLLPPAAAARLDVRGPRLDAPAEGEGRVVLELRGS